MKQVSQAYVTYWRNSLADGELGGGALTQRGAEPLLARPLSELESGQIDTATVKSLFAGEPDDVDSVEVRVRPRVYLARVEHAAKHRSGVPEIVTPLLLTAAVNRDGCFVSPFTAIVPRDILEPLGRGAFAVGSVDDQDEFLARQPPPNEAQGVDWLRLLDYAQRLFDHVCAHWQMEFDGYLSADYYYLDKAATVRGPSKHILGLYDQMRRDKPAVPLFDRYADEQTAETERCLPAGANFVERAGHSGDVFPLAAAQRDALAYVAAMQDGEVLAINGPPGTGKTTLLLSVVASLWARAALAEGGEPPVIVAASTNNQAVTNIIDAFGKDYAEGAGPMAGRWLPQVNSFGAYFPSAKKERENAGKYQTRPFFERVESPDYVAKAKPAYLRAAASALPGMPQYELATVVKALRQLISDGVDALAACEAVQQELGNGPQAAMARRHERQAEARTKAETAAELSEQWSDYLRNESILYALFSWLPPVAEKRLRHARHFLKTRFPAQLALHTVDGIKPIDVAIGKLRQQADEAWAQAKQATEQGDAVLAAERERLVRWRQAVGLTAIPGDAVDSQRDVFADTTIRFPIFLLATHYWEGRWLMDMEKLLPNLAKEKNKTGRKALEPRWRRRMKLTPCIVSTFFMLPKEAKVSRYEAGDYVDDYLYDFIDLLIVDEAGQVAPEVAGASFALAKKALVIGDTQQIEPIWSVPPQVDSGNMVRAGVIGGDEPAQAYTRVADAGQAAASGSVMRIAQTACRYHYDPDLDRGMFLYEHRRCLDDIIGYCNELCYRGKLQPKRGARSADCALPAMGYLHVNGICQRGNGGSRRNQLEADTIAAWLAHQRSDLEARYDKPLAEIVGVVTPFAAQVDAIHAACQSQGLDVGVERGLTIGTVHALQGAERPVVIFSSVYSKHADGAFIDNSPSMLNVAVSRAKDSFLVFGDIDVFEETAPTSPRGLLARFLNRDPNSELQFERQPRRDLVRTDADLRMLRDAREHDQFLLATLAEAKREVHIVTPWIRWERIEETGAFAAMQAAVSRGVVVHVYTDPDFNIGNSQSKRAEQTLALQKTMRRLRSAGLEASYVRRMHSKLVWADANVYCAGSFNWFSAWRTGKYAFHETSFVYTGSAVATEIDIVRQSVEARLQPAGNDVEPEEALVES